MADDFREGDYWVIDDITGFKVRASQTRKMWDGKRVSEKNYETRHPQEFVRAPHDPQTVKDARPRQTAVYIGPLTTELSAAHVAGDTSLTVLSSARMLAGDNISVMCDNNERHLAVIQSVPDAATINILPALPWAASSGNMLFNNTAVADADLG